MGEYERARREVESAQQIREAVFVVLREAGSPLSVNEIVELVPEGVGRVWFDRFTGEERVSLTYSCVFQALRKLEKADAILSVKVHNARLWAARG